MIFKYSPPQRKENASNWKKDDSQSAGLSRYLEAPAAVGPAEGQFGGVIDVS